MQKYLKLIAALVATIISGIVAAMSDDVINNVEWINVAISAVGAAGVFAAPNVPGSMYTKFILAVLSAVLIFLTSAISGGISNSEWLQIAVIALGALGVYAVPNTTGEVRSASYPGR